MEPSRCTVAGGDGDGNVGDAAIDDRGKVKALFAWIFKWRRFIIWKTSIFWGLVACCLHYILFHLRACVCQMEISDNYLTLDRLILLLYVLYIVVDVIQTVGRYRLKLLKMMKSCILISTVLRFTYARFYSLETSWKCWLFTFISNLIVDLIVWKMSNEIIGFADVMNWQRRRETREGDRGTNENHSYNKTTGNSQIDGSGIWFDCQENADESEDEYFSSGYESSEDTLRDYVTANSEEDDQRNSFTNLAEVDNEALVQGRDGIEIDYSDESAAWFECQEAEDIQDNESITSSSESSVNTVKDFVTVDSAGNCFVKFERSEYTDVLLESGITDEAIINDYELRDDSFEERERLQFRDRNEFVDVSPTRYYSSLRKVVEWIQINQFYFEEDDEDTHNEEAVAASVKSVYEDTISEMIEQLEKENNLELCNYVDAENEDTQEESPSESIKTVKESHPLEKD